MNQRGQALPLAAVAAIVLLAAAGGAVDTGYHQYQQRLQQTATDSAALAGARQIAGGDWKAAAQQDAAINGYADNTAGQPCDSTIGRICVQVDNPPAAPDVYAGNAQAVEVQLTVNHPTFFERVAGFTKASVTTRAVAVLQPKPSTNCLFVLNGAANFNGQNTPGATVNAPNCGLMFNQSVNFHGATVTAASVDCAVVTSCCPGGTCGAPQFTAATPVPAAPASDPCIEIAYCAKFTNPAPTCTSAQSFTAGNGSTPVILPGCYSNLNLSKAKSVVFTCGFYMFTGTLNGRPNGGSNATPIPITQSCPQDGSSGGVTFYVGSGGSIDMGNDIISLSPPTSGDYTQYANGEQNVLIYQAPGNTNTVNMNSASCTTSCAAYFSGMIYAPDATLNYNQASTTTTGSVLIIAGTLNANGGINNLYNAPGGTPAFTISVPVLGE